MQTSINGNNIHFTEEFYNKVFPGTLKALFSRAILITQDIFSGVPM